MRFFAILLLLCDLAGGQPAELTVATWNLRNYHIAEVPPTPNAPRSEQSVASMISVLKEVNADILGVCEMGSPAAFADFQQRLAAAGLHYTDTEYLVAADADRHLALVSRFPIVSRNSLPNVRFDLNGAPERVRRGFLDVTIRVAPDYDLRLVGVHLKSKLANLAGGDEAIIRRHEAALLRQHLSAILAADPAANLLTYGDFNDARNEPAIQEIMGVRGTINYMADLPARDGPGDRWTYYWSAADVYSRIDYLFASPSLMPEVIKDSGRINRNDAWLDASDHRAVSVRIVPVNASRR